MLRMPYLGKNRFLWGNLGKDNIYIRACKLKYKIFGHSMGENRLITVTLIVFALFVLHSLSALGELQSAESDFKANYGNDWTLDKNDRGAVSLYGGGVEIETEQGTLTAEAAGDRVLSFLSQNSQLLNINTENLKLTTAEQSDSDKILKYGQNYKEIPVYGGEILVLLKEGKLSYVGNNFYPDVNVATVPAYGNESAIEKAKSDAGTEVDPINIELVVYPKDNSYYLAWKIVFPWLKNELTAPTYFVDALNNEILGTLENLVEGTITGAVNGTIFPQYPNNGTGQVPIKNNYVVFGSPANKVFYSGRGNETGTIYLQRIGKVDLTSATKANLTFVTRYNMERHYDDAYIQASLDNSSWSTSTTSFTGLQNGWVQQTINFDFFAGSHIYLRFRYIPDGSVYGQGWYIDNVTLTADNGTVFTDNAENGIGNWWASGFTALDWYNPAADGLTDANGKFNLTVADNAQGQLYLTLSGPYANVFNEGTYTANHSTYHTITATEYWNWSDNDTSYKDEETNLFYHGNVVHDFFTRGGHFNITDMDFPMGLTANISDGDKSCNAFYTTNNTYFFGADVGCEATSLGADVIYHEYTHGVVDNVYDGEPSGSCSSNAEFPAMNEGWADYFALAILNGENMSRSTIGDGIFGAPIRDVNNTLKYPGDLAGECHDNSQIISGAHWNMRAYLGNNTSDNLAIRAMKLEPVNFTDNLNKILISDDNNSNLTDGTPNIYYICKAFLTDHGINSTNCADSTAPAVTLNAPADSYTTVPSTVALTCTATDSFRVVNVTLWENVTGTWRMNETVTVNSQGQTVTFNKTLAAGIYSWNCRSYDTSNRNAFAASNKTLVIADTSAWIPVVTISSPANNTKTTDNTPNVVANFVDRNDSTGQMTLFVNNTAVSWTNVSYNGSALNNTATTLTASQRADGNYTFWVNVTAGDNESRSVSYNIAIDTTAPADVQSLAESTTGPTWVQWNWTADTTAGFDHYEIRLNDTHKANQTSNSFNFSNLNISYGYEVEVRPVDDLGNIGNWTNDSARTTADTAAPNVTLSAPGNGISTSATTIIFTCSAGDNGYLSNATLYLAPNGTNITPTELANVSGATGSASFTRSLQIGSYAWNCQFNDTSGNNAFAPSNFSFSIVAATPPPSTPSTGTGGGGETTTTTTTKAAEKKATTTAAKSSSTDSSTSGKAAVISVGEEIAKSGTVTVTFEKGDTAKVIITNQSHEIEAKEVTSSSVTLEVRSDPIKVTLTLSNNTTTLDTNNNSKNDLMLVLESIKDSKATVHIYDLENTALKLSIGGGPSAFAIFNMQRVGILGIILAAAIIGVLGYMYLRKESSTFTP